ncbi:MAG: hypothetical protein IJ524_06375 [Bacteroidales bacterium]|nr:hypothetical protein [Bacteroidales bacterium]
MSTTALQGLLEYLYGTLSPKNMRWVADHLIERAEQAEPVELKRYTMAEVNAMIDKAEAEIAAGAGTPHEVVMRRQKERLARMKQHEIEMSEAV